MQEDSSYGCCDGEDTSKIRSGQARVNLNWITIG